MKWIYTSIFICALLVIWSASNIMWSHNHYTGIIKADGKGYYAHLPAVFIYNDLNFGFFDSIENGKYQNANYFYDYRKTVDNNTLNKYFAGTSLAMLPFFAIGHVVSIITNQTADGYSKWYQISISIAAIFYMVATLLMMAKCLRLLDYKPKIIALVLPVILFGSNWYHYVVSEPAMSHVFSIFFITLLFYLALRWSRRGVVNFVYVGLVLGVIIFIRPVNGMAILIIPMCFESWKSFKNAVIKAFKSAKIQLLIGGFGGILVIFLQLIIYKIQTGHFLVYSYEDEGFNFLQPEFFNILFSYKKGFFIYTPLFLIASLSIWFVYKKNKWQGLSLLGVLCVITYVLSSWWNWYYGGSFSSRAFIEYYVLFIWPLCALFETVSRQKKFTKTILITAIVIIVALCQFQTFQYRHMLIHWDNMTKDKYWSVFLKTKKPAEVLKLNEDSVQ